MAEYDTEGLTLYLVNVLQPVGVGDLTSAARRVSRAARSTRRNTRRRVERDLDRLAWRGLLVKRGAKYSVTTLGLDSVSRLGLGRLRDKNRLFILKRAL